MSSDKNFQGYDPNAPGIIGNNIFGLPFNTENAKVVIIPVPWDVTVSNQSGTSLGPQNIKTLSYQIDLFDIKDPDAWKQGIAMEPISDITLKKNNEIREKSSKYISELERGLNPSSNDEMRLILQLVNNECNALINEVEIKALKYLDQKKQVALIGGDHSISLGLIKALAKRHNSFGVLQFDAHADLRNAYEGFEHSHASVMHNALKLEQISKLVQVGIRDYCEEENSVIENNSDRIKTFNSRSLYSRLFEGESWKNICDGIICELPENVYITFDVDFLNPSECPTTGTPVPGGFSFEHALYLVERLVASNKKIVGLDVVETGPGNLDGIVSCRILYRMILNMLN
ncbi:MAG: agmatinase family protein [Bacteroidetes bacterium]|nr:agmatinase family protein [Bacteroidota bacterium]